MGCADQLLHHEVEGRVNGLVEEVEGLENQRTELVVKLVIKMDKEVTELQDLLPTIIAQVGNHASNIQDDVRNVNVNNGRVYTRGRKVAVGITWEDFKALVREEFCLNNEMQNLESEFWCHAMVGAGHAAFTDRFHELARMVAATKPTIIQSAILKAGVLTHEVIRNGSLKKNIKKRGNGWELSRDGNVKGDNKRSRTRMAFATTTNPVRKEAGPRMVNLLNVRNPTAAREACFECGGTDHYKSACPSLNRAPGQRGNRPNQAMAIEGGQGRGNNNNLARARAFVIGAEEARQEPNIMT
nr:hypothetical protein [Tanacetum cinerariifolium]